MSMSGWSGWGIGSPTELGLENLDNNSGTMQGNNSTSMSLMKNVAQLFQGMSMFSSGSSLITQGANYTAGVYRQAGQTAIQGANFTAAVDRQAGNAAMVEANYNVALDQVQTNRQQDVFGRQIGNLMASNKAIIGASGIAFGSKSAMMVQNDVLNTAGRTFAQNSNDALQRQSLITYEGQIYQNKFENEARAAEYSGQVQNVSDLNSANAAVYQGKVDNFKLQQQQANQIGGFVGNVFQQLGGM